MDIVAGGCDVALPVLQDVFLPEDLVGYQVQYAICMRTGTSQPRLRDEAKGGRVGPARQHLFSDALMPDTAFVKQLGRYMVQCQNLPDERDVDCMSGVVIVEY